MADATLPPGQIYHDAGKGIRVVVAAVLLLSAWGYARLGGAAPATPLPPVADPALGIFPSPLRYRVVPPLGFHYIHVRAGPSEGFRIVRRLNASLVVVAVGRDADKAGHLWVKLRRGGFAREDLLRALPVTTQP